MQNNMKRKIIDAFIITFLKNNDEVSKEFQTNFINRALEDKSQSSKLYFFRRCAELNCEGLRDSIQGKFEDIFHRFTNDRKWKTRCQAALGLPFFKKYFENYEGVQKVIEEEAFDMLTDSSQETRIASAKFVSQLYQNTPENKVNIYINEHMKSKTFRERQAVVLILSSLLDEDQPKEQKNIIVQKLKQFQDDPYSSVSQLTKDLLAKHNIK